MNGDKNRDKLLAWAITIVLGLVVAVLLYSAVRNITLAGAVVVAAVVIAAFIDRRR